MVPIHRLTALMLLPLALAAAPRYPFPQTNATYPHGIVRGAVDAAEVQQAFDEFMELYQENPEGTLARIKHDDTTNTVSEGIAYGMLVMVYMDNQYNSTQRKFDKLWAYYKRHVDSKGLMNWKIKGFTAATADGKNSATDADLDAAVGLMQAYKQWGDEKYLNDARALIDSISKHEVNANGYLKPGDTWDTEKNPSYFSTAALQLFRNADDFDWNKVVSNSYSLLKKSQNTTTGLVPNWCNEQGLPSTSTFDPNRGSYTYDATRTPWRLAWAYSWYGHQGAKDICAKIASWVSTKTSRNPANIVDGYRLDGTAVGRYNNAAFVGPFACAGMVDAAHQGWVDTCSRYLKTMAKAGYYNTCLKILTLLHLSGNMPDLWSQPTSIAAERHLSSTHTAVSTRTISLSNNQRIEFTLGRGDWADIRLYSLSGKLLKVATRGFLPSGKSAIPLNCSPTAGTYLIRIATSSTVNVSQVSIVR